VIELELEDPRWREFVESCPEAGPFHLPAWARLLGDCYGYRAFAIAAADDSGKVEAGLPVLELRGGRRVSLPFTDACAPLALSADGLASLSRALARAAGRFEVRAPFPGAAAHPVAVQHLLPLNADPQLVFSGLHKSRMQRPIAKAQREGVAIRTGDARADLVDAFYDLHVQTRRRQGVPVQPRRFFELLWERMIEPGHGFLLVADAEGAPAAAGVFLSWNGTTVYKFGASDEARLRVRPNHLLLWDAIRRSCERGDRTFDFGRTDYGNAGLRTFKSGFGAGERPRVYAQRGNGTVYAGGGRATRALAPVIRRSPPWVCRGLGELLYKYAA
jgi:CelD/BcsL family acetyltransferase involved in cellulose biosynthesis